MVKSGLSSQNAFGASAAGTKGKQTSTSNYKMASVSSSYTVHSYSASSSSSLYHVKSPPSIKAGFNHYSAQFQSYSQSHSSTSFRKTTRNLVANRNEFKQAHYANDQNWIMMKSKISSSALPAPSMEYSRSRNLQHEYQNFRNMYEARGEEIHVRFESQRQRIRQTGVTLERSFNNKSSQTSQSTTRLKTKEVTRTSQIERRAYKRRTMNFHGNSQSKSKGRGR